MHVYFVFKFLNGLLWKVNFEKTKSGTSHGEISVSCTSVPGMAQWCCNTYQFSLYCRPLSAKWSLTGGWKHEKIYFKLLALKVVAFAYKSWSLTRVIRLGKYNTFDILENWSPARGGSGGLTVINCSLSYVLGICILPDANTNKLAPPWG